MFCVLLEGSSSKALKEADKCDGGTVVNVVYVAAISDDEDGDEDRNAELNVISDLLKLAKSVDNSVSVVGNGD